MSEREIHARDLVPNLDFQHALPDNAIALEAVMLVKILPEDGPAWWTSRVTPGVNCTEVLGAAEHLAELQREAIRRTVR